MKLSDTDKSRVLEELENCRLDHERQATLFEGYTRGRWHKDDEAELAGLIERVREAFGEGVQSRTQVCNAGKTNTQ